MITLFIIIALAYGFYEGFRRGLIMQFVRLLGYMLSVLLATRYFEPISRVAEMFIPFPSVQLGVDMAMYTESQSFGIQDAFYRVITFVLITIIGWLVTNFISVMLTKIMYYDVLKWVNHIGGGLINVLITYTVIFVVLFILSLVPIEFVQQQFVDNPLAYWIVSQTPVLSDFALNAWLQVVPS